MYVETVKNRNSPPCILLRESFRHLGKVKKRTVANITHLPTELINDLRILLKGGKAVDDIEDAFDIIRSRPHGHVVAVLGTLRKIGLHRIIAAHRSSQRDRVEAMIVSRIIAPASKLATAQGLQEETLHSSLGRILGLSDIDEDDLYETMDWLYPLQEQIERTLAAKHLVNGMLVLYDVTSTYVEGRLCPLARLGHNRDGKKGKLQIIIGLLCNGEGCPIAIEVFDGNTADPSTLDCQIKKVRERFGIDRVIFVGDRGLITDARIREELKPIEGLDWITALRTCQIRKLVETKAVQMSLFDQDNIAEIVSEEYPDERLMVCRNPILAADRTRTRAELLQATERLLDEVVEATQRPKRRLKGQARIGLRVGKLINKYKVAKHFTLHITDEGLSYERDEERIKLETALDGLYVIRTNVKASRLGCSETVGAYKDLSKVERAFRCIKSVDLKIRPINHRLAERIRSHVFICMLAYYVEWHMRKSLAPILFDDHNTEGRTIKSIVDPQSRSDAASRKALIKRTEDDEPVESFQALLKDLSTVCQNTIQPRMKNAPTFEKTTLPTPHQILALDLLGVAL